MLVAIGYHMLQCRQSYCDLGGHHLEEISKDQLQRYFLKRLQRLGLKVTVEPAAASA